MTKHVQTFGQYLLNQHLPDEYKIHGSVGKKELKKSMNELAHKDQDTYVKTISGLKREGDRIATMEGWSAGLDDIEPDRKVRDPILNRFQREFDVARNDDHKREILERMHEKMTEVAMRHPGEMTQQIRSGSRGPAVQYMKIVTTPTYARSSEGKVEPWLIRRSYAEGLSPADYWVANNEAIADAITSKTSVTDPGELSKLLVSNMSDLVVTEDDCGTTNGLLMDSSDVNVIDRFLARDTGHYRRNTLVTPDAQGKLSKTNREILVRSPMTCEAGDGVCQKCQGLNEKGQIHDIGINVGVRSANAMAEPLTQFALNAKHGVRTAKSDRLQVHGVKGFRQTILNPALFLNKATLSEEDGKVTKIEVAPQGGHFVHIGEASHYVPPNLDILVKSGDPVEKGDALSEGISKPSEVVRLKGLGAGRLHMVKSLRNLYKTQGVDLDPRHFELLAKGELNSVRIMDDPGRNFIKGDVIQYNHLRSILGQGTKEIPVDEALGETLGKEYFHFLAGTRITASVMKFFKEHQVHSVRVAPRAPEVEFVMKPATSSPLLDPDWMSRLAHRELKATLEHAAHFGDISNLHGTHPVPAYAMGSEFGEGESGRY